MKSVKRISMARIRGLISGLLIAGAVISFSCNKSSSPTPREVLKAPIANAGPDQSFLIMPDSIVLDGSASSDPDGRITKTVWRHINGPLAGIQLGTPDAVTTTVRKLTGPLPWGTYKFELRVTDNDGIMARDTVIVTVSPIPVNNQPPVARAGEDQTLVWPTNFTHLDGSASSDPDSNIVAYSWVNVSGPSSITITNPGAARTEVTGMTEGVYRFELTVTDAGGFESKDMVDITVAVVITKEVIFTDQVLANYCYDPRPCVCWISGEGPSYGSIIKDTMHLLPDSTVPLLAVWVKMDTSSVWERVPEKCWQRSDDYEYPTTNYTFCRTSQTLSILSWFCSDISLEGRKADVKVRF